jgi:hypothetical protein
MDQANRSLIERYEADRKFYNLGVKAAKENLFQFESD